MFLYDTLTFCSFTMICLGVNLFASILSGVETAL